MIDTHHLPHQHKNEEVIILLRRHPFIIFKKVSFYILMILIPLVLNTFINTFFPHTLDNTIIKVPITLSLIAYYLFIWLFLYHTWIDYYLDVWIVTTHRILSIELEGLFNRTVAEHKLSRIQDVTTEQIGIFAHLLDYGEVHIQTASSQKRFIFEQIPNPEKVSRQITQMISWNHRAYPSNN